MPTRQDGGTGAVVCAVSKAQPGQNPSKTPARGHGGPISICESGCLPPMEPWQAGVLNPVACGFSPWIISYLTDCLLPFFPFSFLSFSLPIALSLPLFAGVSLHHHCWSVDSSLSCGIPFTHSCWKRLHEASRSTPLVQAPSGSPLPRAPSRGSAVLPFSLQQVLACGDVFEREATQGPGKGGLCRLAWVFQIQYGQP